MKESVRKLGVVLDSLKRRAEMEKRRAPKVAAGPSKPVAKKPAAAAAAVTEEVAEELIVPELDAVLQRLV